MAAVQASDYGIASFRFLWKLILVEGRANHLKITQFILLFIYKNILCTFPYVVFGFYSLFTAQRCYDDLYVMFYNLAFTAFLIPYIGVFYRDKHYLKLRKIPEPKDNKFDLDESIYPCNMIEVDENLKASFPLLYYETQSCSSFTLTNLSFEILVSLLQSVFLVYVSFAETQSFVTFAYSLYFNVIITQTATVMARIPWNWVFFSFAFFLSILPFMVFSYLLDYFGLQSQILRKLLLQPRFWSSAGICVIVGFFSGILGKRIFK